MPARRSAGRAAALALVALATAVPGAPAAVSPTRVLDQGPDVIGNVATALADDGTGGAVWLRRDGGVSHVFAARFSHGVWSAAVRVDVGQRFASSWPTIAAAEGGRMIVAWAQEYGPDSDRLYSAFLSPGAARFDIPAAIDLDINEATGPQPSLAMSAAGAALIAYRVVLRDLDARLPQGLQNAEYRIARFRSRRWSSLGRLNRDVSLPVPRPADANGPQVAIGQDGNGAVAWLEPDAALIQHAWARRVFQSALGAPLRVDATNADALSVAMGPLGDVAIAYRRQPSADGGTAPGVSVATLPQAVDADAAKIAGPWAAPGTPVGAPAVSLGTKGTWRVAVPTVGGILTAPSAPATTGGVNAAAAQTFGGGDEPTISEGADGTAAVAWRQGARVAVSQQLQPGTVRGASLTAPGGGAVAELAGGVDGLGDDLLAWRQGEDDAPVIAAAIVDAPPGAFLAYGTQGWVRPNHATITWDAPADAIGGLRYAVVLDGVVAADGLAHTGVTLPTNGIDDGRYAVQVRARDAAGQDRLSATATLKVDGTPPALVVRRLSGRRLQLRLTDGTKNQVSGVNATATRLNFGDGKITHALSKVTHRYPRAGTFRISARVADKAGNTDTIRRTVRIG